MEIQSLQRSLDVSRVQPEHLSGAAGISEREKVSELCRQFEAVLLRQILKDAQKTIIKSDLTTESASADIYQDMITSQLAESISVSGSLGFAQTLEQQLTRQMLAGSKQTPENK